MHTVCRWHCRWHIACGILGDVWIIMTWSLCICGQSWFWMVLTHYFQQGDSRWFDSAFEALRAESMLRSYLHPDEDWCGRGDVNSKIYWMNIVQRGWIVEEHDSRCIDIQTLSVAAGRPSLNNHQPVQSPWLPISVRTCPVAFEHCASIVLSCTLSNACCSWTMHTLTWQSV